MAKKYNSNVVNMVKLSQKNTRSLYYEADTRLTTAESIEEKIGKIYNSIGHCNHGKRMEDDEVLYEESSILPTRVTFTI